MSKKLDIVLAAVRDGTMSKQVAARRLGVSMPTLYRRLKAAGIACPGRKDPARPALRRAVYADWEFPDPMPIGAVARKHGISVTKAATLVREARRMIAKGEIL